MCRYVQVQQSYHLQRKIEILSAQRSTPCGRKVCNEISQNETYDSDRPSPGYNTTVFGHPPNRVQVDPCLAPPTETLPQYQYILIPRFNFLNRFPLEQKVI